MILNWQVKYLFEQVLYDWHALTDAKEIEIIQKYANRGRLYTIFAGCKSKTHIMRICECLLLLFIIIKKYILYLTIIIFRNISLFTY